jgi:hypothetical protein
MCNGVGTSDANRSDLVDQTVEFVICRDMAATF